MPEIDLILGGHDHDFFYQAGKDNLIIKSGTDFRELTLTKFSLQEYEGEICSSSQYNFQNLGRKFYTQIFKGNRLYKIETERLEVCSHMKEDENITKFANNLQDQTQEKFKQVLCVLNSPVEARFSSVRTKSLPISNFISDLVNIYMATDCTLINSGSLRMDSIISAGELK